ncbi:xylose isomerase [Marisediminicola sp. UYEF4]|uniref:sugar phosphate isomerase/epimerase family protein n=1 Tax=Marisediminicola sp. UYEF4 TaxID=1756384 RepID=UPI0033929B42
MSDIKYSTRLNSFGLGKGRKYPTGEESTLDLIALAGQVTGLTSLELNYPEHFGTDSVADISAALDNVGLDVQGVQLRWPAPMFADGAFSNPDPEIRRAAVTMVKEAIGICRELGADHVLLWPAHDGYEYPLQMDYMKSWDWMVECLREVADVDPGIRVSIEYKPAEPRGRTLLNTTGAVIKLIRDCDRPNLGVTLDFGHLLMARENPAQSAAMCLREQKLFGLQLNDSHGVADDGLLVGSIHFSETLELAYYLVREGYAGTYYFDTDPVRENPVRECELNIERMGRIIEVATDMVRDDPALPTGDALHSASVLWTKMLGA